MKGLLVHVLRSPYSSPRQLTAQFSQFILVGDGIPELFEVTNTTPPLQLVSRVIFGKPYLHAEPVDKPANTLVMAGGNFIYSSDSRFPSMQPISVHDHFETPEQYKEMES